MRNSLFLAAAAFSLAAVACSKNDTDAADANMDMNADMSMGNDMNMADNGNMAMPMTAAAFAATIAGGNMYEIESGKLAQTMAMNDACRKMGAMLVTDHTKQQDMLKTAAAAATPPVTLPTAIPPEHQAQLDALKATKGAEFDRLFLAQQKEAHSKMLAALKSYAASGDSPSLKAFAAKAVPGVEQHYNMTTSMKM